jgi:hypothetical protein
MGYVGFLAELLLAECDDRDLTSPVVPDDRLTSARKAAENYAIRRCGVRPSQRTR